jgi:GR25 family glycosyltransferase involved in LPS biosynthesis
MYEQLKYCVINLPHRPDKLKYFQDQLKFFSFDCDVIEGVQPREKKKFSTKNHRGCALAHLKVWEKMKQDNIPYLCVFEDDNTFYEKNNFEKELKIICDYLVKKSISWDIFYLNNHDSGGAKSYGPIKFINEQACTNSYIINKSFVQKVLLYKEKIEQQGKPIDWWLNDFKRISKCCSTKNLCGQNRKYSSDINVKVISEHIKEKYEKKTEIPEKFFVTHPHHCAIYRFYKDGVFFREDNYDYGNWEKKDDKLILKWKRWGTDILTKNNNGYGNEDYILKKIECLN